MSRTLLPILSTAAFMALSSLHGIAQWNAVNNASLNGNDCVQLTTTGISQTGAAWHDCLIHLGADFDLEFSVNVGNNDGGADGMCFVLHQAGNVGNNLVGSNGGDIGYANGPFGATSIAVEIDTYFNGQNGDPSYDHIAINGGGQINHNLSGPVQANVSSNNIETGLSYPFRLTWDAASNTLEVYFNGVLRKTLTLDLTNNIFNGNPLVNWGWTGTTGGATNVHSFCLENAYYSTHIEAVTATPEGPWQVCEGQELTLTASPLPPAATATWVANDAAELTLSTGGTYVLYAEDDEGCPTHNSVVVEDAPGPNLSLLVDPELIVCDDPSTVLLATADPGATLGWEGQAGDAYTVSEDGVYMVEGALDGCVETQSVEVTFQISPVLQFSSEGTPIEGEVSFCPGDQMTLDVSATAGAPASWDDNSMTALVVEDNGVFSASASINGCDADPASIAVVLHPLPGANISAQPEILCWETTGVVSALLDDGSSLTQWYYPPGTSGLSTAGPGQYQMALVSENGCQRTETFDYDMLPPINTGLTDPDPLCDDSAALLSVTGTVDGLSWNVGGSNSELLVVPSMGEGPFVATVTLGACTQSDTATVTWWPTPSVGSLPDTASRCVLDPAFNFTWQDQSDDPIGAWVWTVNGDGASAGYSITEEGDYVIEVQDNATGCLDSHELHLNVLPNIGVDATVRDALVCIGDSTRVEIEILAVEETNPYELPFSVFWSTEGVYGLESLVGAGEHVVTVTNACGSSADVVVVEDEYCGCNVWVPNAFTPDGDGLNEAFQIVSSCEYDSFEFTVFNRWGQRVWSTDNPDVPWNGGTTLLGAGNHFVPGGQYAYRLRYQYTDDGVLYTEDKSGRIAVIR